MPAQVNRPIVTEEEAVIALPRIIPRTKPTPIPTPSIFDEPSYCLKVNKAWAAHFLGVILVLNNPDTWVSDDDHDVEWARSQVVEWVARFLTEDMCMPCCDDLIEQITNLVTINTNMLTQITTIVNNLTTIINNDTTIINQNDQTIVNNLFQQYNQFATVNNQYTLLNQMFYDGTPQSIAPDIEDNWSNSSDDASNGALCAAINRYIADCIYQRTYEINSDAAALGGALDIIITAMIAAAEFTAGISAAVGAVVAGVNLGIAISLQAWNAAVQDPEAKRKVACCMYDGLKDQPVNQETFKASVSDCGFTDGNEVPLSALVNGANQIDENYTAFLRSMNGAPSTNGQDCVCDCDDDIALEDFAGTGCVITPMGNCIYRFVQPTLDPTYSVYYFSFRDIMSQCLHVERSADPSKPTAAVGYYTTVVDCHDVETSFPGGFEDVPDGHAPGLKSAHWFQGPDTGNVTYYKITLCADPDGC